MTEISPDLEQELVTKIYEFLQHGPPHVSNFRLIGEGDVPIRFEDFVCLFPSSAKPWTEMKIGALSTTRATPQDLYGRVRGLTIPQRVVDLRIKDNPPNQQKNWARSFNNGWPLMVVAFGQEENGHAQAAVLFLISGISPRRMVETTSSYLPAGGRKASFNARSFFTGKI